MTDAPIIAVWFSRGAASAVALKETITKYGDSFDVRAVYCPVIEEDDDGLRFERDVAAWLGIEIEHAINKDFPKCSAVDVWEQRKFMSGPLGAPCTIELKKMARRDWEERNNPAWHVFGFTLEEKVRHRRFVMGERSNVLPVLIEAGITKTMCFDIVRNAGIKLPHIYDLGYPNANCIGCVKASSATYWNHVRRQHPLIFQDRLEQSRRLGAKLARCHPKYLSFCSKRECGEWYDDRTGKCLHKTDEKTGKRKLEPPRVFLDELPFDAKGAPLKTMQFDCGIFCEERPPGPEQRDLFLAAN
jgi:hypothetical protein